MPPQVWRVGARVSHSHPHEYDSLQPGQKRRKRRAQYGTLGAAVVGEAGRFHVRWDDEGARVGSVSGPEKMTLHPDDAGRHNLSPLPQSQRGTRSQPGVDAPQEEGDAAEPESSDHENISGGDGDGDDGGAEGGDDDVSGPDAAAAPGERLQADLAAISQPAGETLLVKGVTWTVAEGVSDLDEVAPDVLQSGRDVFAPGITVESEIDAFTHMLWMDIPEMFVVIKQAALRDAAGQWSWKAVSAHELGIWFGLLLGSLQFAEQGDQLWDSKYDTMSRPDFRPYMARTRFKLIRKYVGRYGDKRKPCHVCYKVLNKKVKSRWWCARCRKGVCRTDTGRRCFDTHAVIVSRDTASETIPETSAVAPQATRRARGVL